MAATAFMYYSEFKATKGKEGYTKREWSRNNAAYNLGAYYDWEDDCYVCPTCKGSFSTKEEYKQDHDCDLILEAAYPPAIVAVAPHVIEAHVERVEEVVEAPRAPEEPTAFLIQFGSFEATWVTTGPTGEPQVAPALVPVVEAVVDNIEAQQVTELEHNAHDSSVQDGRILEAIQLYDGINSALDELATTAMEENYYMGRNAQRKTRTQKRRVKRMVWKVKKSVVEDTTIEENIIHSIMPVCAKMSIAGGSAPSEMQTPAPRAKLTFKRKTKKVKEARPQRKLTMNTEQLETLYRAVGKIVRKGTKCVEICDKRCMYINTKETKFGKQLYVRLLHHQGIRKRKDIYTSKSQVQVLGKVQQAFKTKHIKLSELAPGTSGMVLSDPAHNPFFYRDGLFIVRGRCDGVLIDARSRVTFSTCFRMEHYTGKSISEDFFSSFSEVFVRNRPDELDHECARDFTVQACGEVAALVTHAIFPCGKITCKRCLHRDSELPREIEIEKDYTRVTRIRKHVAEHYPDFTHVTQMLDKWSQLIALENTNYDACTEIQRIVGDRDQSPFVHINNINEILLKGAKLTHEDLHNASDYLLEIARYLKNRTENIQLGDIKSFRNKISSKAHINTSLMCDNQLDKNGNFVWGLRGVHAKRFFTNFFDVVNPGEGYERHIVRKHVRGERKLSIGNLIMSTNFEALRKQIQGEPMPYVGITNACVSRKNANYLYTCSCVTLEDGRPLLSDLKLPTKRHLVIGNSGDSKFVDLPVLNEEKMYIAKEGYCYMNIFLAMLVNVNEDDAKDFTKFVRDVIVPRLGTWPAMADVATACYLLVTLFPDVYNAELPRILVDHANKTLHVLDSYGSISTGYHVLKTGTVAQLLEFAHNNTDSEIKTYNVGGDFYESSASATVNILIQSIYKPQKMLEILLGEPYLIVLSIISPSVLIAMYNTGTFERALELWLPQRTDLANLAAILSTLAQKVAMSDLISQQHSIMADYAHILLENLVNGVQIEMSYRLAMETLTLRIASKESDIALATAGFKTTSLATHEFIEKNYAKALRAAWDALSWSEKFSVIRCSTNYCRFGRKFLTLKTSADYGAPLDVSMRSLFREKFSQMLRVRSKITNGLGRARDGVRRRVAMTLSTQFARMMPDIFKVITVMTVTSLLLTLYLQSRELLDRIRVDKLRAQEVQERLHWQRILTASHIAEKNEAEDIDAAVGVSLAREFPDTYKFFMDHRIKFGEPLYEQAKNKDLMQLEKVIAYITLVMMAFDSERSDCVYKILNKFKGVISTTEQENVYLQSLDDFVLDVEDKMTVDFELDVDELHQEGLHGVTFKEWWNNQINRGNTLPHYRTEGHFMEFTRVTSAAVSSEIAHSVQKDFLIRGAVGSGKSTGLPYYLSKRGRVLMLEPTRPLADNVHKQLQSQPFLVQPTLRMRGKSVFGSTPISIMTSGYALHHFAHNVCELSTYDFVIIDECHVNDASAIAFRNLLVEHEFPGKVLKVSATPPGREVEFQTQFPVRLKTEEGLTFTEFVQAQGTGSNADVVQDGDNILVYVSSYNEVDMLSKLLIQKHYKVTKIDGRTMKQGGTEIITEGTATRKHFVVATNIIENGVTLDIDVVVDFGLKVIPVLDVDNRAITATKVSVSFGERIQRLGRVGRHKAGVALRIGTTTKHLAEIPEMIATEAAFLCFMYNLPVTTQNVTTTILESATLKQARTMAQFELPYFYTINLVRFDGSIHPAINEALKDYKLNNSEIYLNKLAIPNKQIASWLTSEHYKRIGLANESTGIRIPFVCRDVPDRLHDRIWNAVLLYKHDASIGRLTSAQAAKVAYTLQTDTNSIPRTLAILNRLIANEQRKQAHFEATSSNSFNFSNFSLNSICETIRSRYATKHTVQNIAKLQQAKDQIQEFANLAKHDQVEGIIKDFGYLESVYFQSEDELAKYIGLEGRWNKKLVTRDLLILGGVFIGGCWMVYTHFRTKCDEPVYFQGKRNQKHKLRMKKIQGGRGSYEVDADPETIEHYFGSAYNNKGKKKGTTRGMGHKTRRFINMYGYDPADFSFIRFVDPLTGLTIDDSPHASIGLIQDAITNKRMELREEGVLEAGHLRDNQTIHAYLVNSATKKVLKVDMTPHRSMQAGEKSTSVAGFPEREGELRQTGRAVEVEFKDLPKANEEIHYEGATLQRGVRDYNPISSVLCHLKNESDGECISLYGIGYGPYILTNKHLFRKNNGTLSIVSAHGVFTVKNTTTIKQCLFKGRDMVLIRLPKDFPPFPKKIKFRVPEREERICMVTTNFQIKSLSSLVSESSCTFPADDDVFWMHWITTKDGQCGSPLVSVRDGCIVGIHSASNFTNTNNYFTSIPSDFVEVLETAEEQKWVTGWKFNTDSVCWGGRQVFASKPTEPFQTCKDVHPLASEPIYAQNATSKWVQKAVMGNLRPVADCTGQLVTKHVVRGKCALFDLFLRTHPEQEAFFRPFMGAYGPSRLNREAFLKDIMKYSTEIEVGSVNTDLFEEATKTLISDLKELGMGKMNYITDEESIFQALNMKAAVGALYSGKKQALFGDATQEVKEEYLRASCKRVFMGKMGVWNGSLKAELRPMEKLMANKTRTFTAAPIDTLLAGKVCVDDFNNHFYDLNLKGPWTVGMTKFYGGWDQLMQKLPEGWVYCDADGSQFDSSLTPYLINAVLQIRLEFMEEWDIGARMLENLYTEVVYTPILTPDGTIIKKHKGNNSGQPSTVVDNTLMVILAVIYTCRTHAIPKEQIVYFVNGDDLLLAIHPDYAHLLAKFQATFSELGLKYNFDDVKHSREDLWFMSHKAIKEGECYIPKLEEERIVSILEWDRSKEPTHRLEALCAAMIESWGYAELTYHIREFYSWVLEQAPYRQLAQEGKAPYLAETALRRLYTGKEPRLHELEPYIAAITENLDFEKESLYFQGTRVDAGTGGKPTDASIAGKDTQESGKKDKDVDAGTSGTFAVPRIKAITPKLRFPKYKNKVVVNLEHLLEYKPQQQDLSNARATHEQFGKWYTAVKEAYGLEEAQFEIVLNGLMVWCIENGTSPNINGVWVMMDGEEQISYPLKPVVENAQPTLRQIMAHFSDLAEAYVEMRNREAPYMPRYGLQRNLTDMSLARYAFDFYELNSKTPTRAREAHMQMKAAAIRNSSTRLFGLDGNVGTAEEDTERHTAHDVNRNMHTLLGVRQ